MRPLIGITSYYVKDRELSNTRNRGLPGQDMLMSTMDYSRCVERAGGIPVAIPVIENNKYIDELVERIDGFVFTGGPDIHPGRYNQPVKEGLGFVVTERDDFEFKLLEKVLKKDKPVLGICRGFQLINVYFGGTLHQDIYSAKLTDIEHFCKMVQKYSFCHRIKMKTGSKIYGVFNEKEIMVNSYHHQAIDRVGEGLIETARSEDGIIEGFEHPEYSFLIGVQWHPEMMAEVHEEQIKIFKLLINYTSIKKSGVIERIV